MSKINSKNSLFIVFTGVIISVGRFLFGKIQTTSNDGQHILIIMAVINYVALGVVLLFLHTEFCKKFEKKLHSYGLETNLKRTCTKVICIFSISLLVLYLLFGVLYTLKLKSNDANDVVSIISLAISIATNGLVEDFSDDYYKLILNIAKCIKKRK